MESTPKTKARPKSKATPKSKGKFKTVDEYFSALPANTKGMLTEMRKTIKKTAPHSEEVMSYNVPAFKLEGMLVWYAAHREHIGFYPRASAIEAFKKELSVYKGAKGSVQFPIDKPLPLTLIAKIVKYRLQENLEKAHRKSLKKPPAKKGLKTKT